VWSKHQGFDTQASITSEPTRRRISFVSSEKSLRMLNVSVQTVGSAHEALRNP